ncbi:MAG: hypothetical protein ACKOWF_06060 [Chloroflexota bacterium]
MQGSSTRRRALAAIATGVGALGAAMRGALDVEARRGRRKGGGWVAYADGGEGKPDV